MQVAFQNTDNLALLEVRAITCVAGGRHLRLDALTGALLRCRDTQGALSDTTGSNASSVTEAAAAEPSTVSGIAALSLQRRRGEWKQLSFKMPWLQTLSGLQELTLADVHDLDLAAPWPPQLRCLDITINQLRVTGAATAGLQRLEQLYIRIKEPQVVNSSPSNVPCWEMTSG